jgi:hypothetical protein
MKLFPIYRFACAALITLSSAAMSAQQITALELSPAAIPVVTGTAVTTTGCQTSALSARWTNRACGFPGTGRTCIELSVLRKRDAK